MLVFIVKDTMHKIKMKQPLDVFAIKVHKENIISVQIVHTNQLEKHSTSRSMAKNLNISEGKIK